MLHADRERVHQFTSERQNRDLNSIQKARYTLNKLKDYLSIVSDYRLTYIYKTSKIKTSAETIKTDTTRRTY